MSPDDELAKWSFFIAEVSAGVYWATGIGPDGRTVELLGSDSDSALERCRAAAAASLKRSRSSREPQAA
jgi:hypothetical protein